MIIASAVRKFLVGYRYRIIIIKVHISIRVKKLHRNFPVLTFMMYNDYTFRNVFERVIALNCCKIYAPKISYYHISFALTKRVFISRIYAVFWLKLLICIYLKTDKFCLLYLIFASCFNSKFLHTLFFLLHINIMKDALATFLKLSDICLRSSSFS